MGIWNLLKVIMSYCNYNTLGAAAAVAYKIPFFQGKKDQHAVSEIQNSFFSFSMLAASLTSAGLLVVAFVLKQKFSVEVVVGIYIISIYTILQKIYNTYVIFTRAYKDFTALSKLIWIDSLLNLLFVFLLVKHFKLYGLYASVILTIILDILCLRYLTKYELKYQIVWRRIVELIKYGTPILISGILSTILFTTDRIMIAKFIGVTQVGYYGIGIMARGYVYALSNDFSTIVMPHMAEYYGSTAKTEHMEKIVAVSTEVIAYLLPFALGGIFIVFPLLVNIVLPQFTPGILVMQILLLDMFFRSCAPQFKHFLIVVGKQTKLMFITILAIILNILLNYLFIKRGWSIYGVALATSITSFFVFLVILLYMTSLVSNKRSIYKLIFKIMLPLSYAAFVVLSIDRFINIQSLIIKTMVNLFILIIFYLPLLIYINRKTKVFVLIKENLKDKIIPVLKRKS
jgi:O-antigen/teichoic acid export membrane protein